MWNPAIPDRRKWKRWKKNIDQMNSLIFKALYSPYYFADLVSKGAQFQTLNLILTVRLRTSLIHVRGRSTCPPFLSPCTKHLASGNLGGRCLHLAPGTSPKPGKRGMPEKSFQNAVQKSFFQVASAPQSKVMAKT